MDEFEDNNPSQNAADETDQEELVTSAQNVTFTVCSLDVDGICDLIKQNRQSIYNLINNPDMD